MITMNRQLQSTSFKSSSDSRSSPHQPTLSLTMASASNLCWCPILADYVIIIIFLPVLCLTWHAPGSPPSPCRHRHDSCWWYEMIISRQSDWHYLDWHHQSPGLAPRAVSDPILPGQVVGEAGHVPRILALVQQPPDPPPHLGQVTAPGPQKQLDGVTCISQSEVTDAIISQSEDVVRVSANQRSQMWCKHQPIRGHGCGASISQSEATDASISQSEDTDANISQSEDTDASISQSEDTDVVRVSPPALLIRGAAALISSQITDWSWEIITVNYLFINIPDTLHLSLCFELIKNWGSLLLSGSLE